MKKISFPYFFITALASALWLPWLLAKGMFMDGLYNAILAQNLAYGISTFWAPQANDYSNPAYWNNPPFAMFTLGLFYKIFGDPYVMDKIYSLGCAIFQLLLLTWVWSIFWRDDKEIKKYSWLPCLLWLISPLTGWCYSNNLMENTMSIFTTSSLISFLCFLRNKKYLLLCSLAGSCFIFLASLTKGPTGLFPLAVPLFFILSESKESWKGIFSYSFLQIAFFILLFAFVFSMPAPKNFLEQYITLRLGPALNHSTKPETETYRVFKEMFIMLLPFMILYGLSFFRREERKESRDYRRIAKALSFILAGLAASLPIVFSMVQRKFYLLPSLPVFALGFSILILPVIKFIELRSKLFMASRISTIAKWSCLLAILICISLCVKNKNVYSRDAKMLADIENMLPLIAGEETVCADWQLYDEWTLRAYCTRHYRKKIYMPDKILETKFYMTKPEQRGDKLSFDAVKIYSGSTFDLYQMKL